MTKENEMPPSGDNCAALEELINRVNDTPLSLREFEALKTIRAALKQNQIAPEQEEEIHNCPECGSGDVHFCNISVRPYCSECHYWGAVNFGTKAAAIKAWNPQTPQAECAESEER